MAADINEVRHIAELARLSFSEEELGKFTKEFNEILSYMELLNEADTENVEPLTHPFDPENIFREDVIKEGSTHDEALQNAPETDGTYFIVPKIINTETKK